MTSSINLREANQQLVQLMVSPQVNGSYWLPLNGLEKDNASNLCRELLQHNALSLALPKSVLRTYINRDIVEEEIFVLKDVIKEAAYYKKQGGADLFSFVEIQAIPMQTNGVLISENLPESMEYLDSTHKSTCWELIDSLPFVLKAIVDYVKRYSLLNVQFVVTNIKFHPVDYRNYAYYICTKRCLDKIFSIH